MIKDVPTEEIPSLKDSADFHVDPIIGTYYLSLNLERDAFQDARVRKALSLAIDRDYVANTLMQGTYSPADNFKMCIRDRFTGADGSHVSVHCP